MLKLRDIQDPEIIYFDPVLRYREREREPKTQWQAIWGFIADTCKKKPHV